MVGKLLFTGNDGVHGEEMWVTDGTAAGTYALGDIQPRSDFQRADIIVFGNGEALFPASGATGGVELWATNGSAAGTAVFAGIPSSANASPPGADISDSAELGGGDVVFTDTPFADVGSYALWTTNGTAAGTSQIREFAKDPSISVGPSLVTLDNGEVMFNAFDPVDGTELWITDGSAAGTTLLSDLTPGPASTILDIDAVASLGNGQDVFIAGPFGPPSFLAVTDATTAGTSVLRDFGSNGVDDLTALGNGNAVFSGDDGTTGKEPWVTNAPPPAPTYCRISIPGLLIPSAMLHQNLPCWVTARRCLKRMMARKCPPARNYGSPMARPPEPCGFRPSVTTRRPSRILSRSVAVSSCSTLMMTSPIQGPSGSPMARPRELIFGHSVPRMTIISHR